MGTVQQNDANRLMPLLTRFSYAQLYTRALTKYEEDNGHTLVIHIWAEVMTHREEDRAWLNSRFR